MNIQDYSSAETKKRLAAYKDKGKSYWQQKGEESALLLFHDMAKRVPAYKDFLSKNHIKPDSIKTIDDMEHVPVMDKENYIDQYKLSELCFDGTLSNSYMLSASSGSTGKPYFWPRSKEQTMTGAMISEGIYKEIVHIDSPTLYIVAFGMGTWIAGTYMMMSTQLVAEEGYPITVVTPGLNKDEIIRLAQLGKAQFDRTVIIGYPPFIKDVMDYGVQQGIDWKSFSIQFLFSGEAITEGWRSHLQHMVGLKDIYSDAVNILGSADVGLMAHETPLSIALRRHLIDHPKLVEELYQTERVPALYQYDPELRYVEVLNNELIVTTQSGIPLCRYNTKDIGTLFWPEDLPIVKNELSKVLKHHSVWNIPILSLFGRGKFSATLYGITIYPEYMKQLLDHPDMEAVCTGKFILKTVENADHDQILDVHLELKEHIVGNKQMQQKLVKIIVQTLPALSSEYKHLVSMLNEKVYPHVIVHEYGDPEYFPRGIIKKTS